MTNVTDTTSPPAPSDPPADGIRPFRLPVEAYGVVFDDIHPPLDAHEAQVAADRCYFCHDAPCITACPTEIDIPLFIRQIQTGQPEVAGRTIFDQNILGGMCARVCPTDILCEGACVREAAEGKPVEIGRLQRHATDALMARPGHPFRRAAPTGRRIAVVGAGPAGLACAHRLAMLGHDVAVFDARPRPGGLNEYGIAAYKTPHGFAQAEVDWLLGIGGITLHLGKALGREVTLGELQADHDAVFLGMGLGGTNSLDLPGEDAEGVRDAIDFIAELRQAQDLARLPVGRHVVVIGGGMTAVDAAVQSRLLGAEHVTMVYRRGRDRMGASDYELSHAATEGVRILTDAAPTALVVENGRLVAVDFAYTETAPDGRLQTTGTGFRLPADQCLKAIGQRLALLPEGLETTGGKIATTGPGRTSIPGVWAGGDCAAGGDDLTVTAVAQGRDAAEDIHRALFATGLREAAG